MRQGRAPKFQANVVRMSVSVEPEVNKWLVSKGYGNMSEVINKLCREQMKVEMWVEEKTEELINPNPEPIVNPESKYAPEEKKLIEEKQNYDEQIGEKYEQARTGE